MFCVSCGKEISDDSKFCEYCCAKQLEESAPEQESSERDSLQASHLPLTTEDTMPVGNSVTITPKKTLATRH